MFCIYCGTQLDEGAVICPSCNAAVNYSGAAMAAQNPLKDPRGMKWFKFIIYFQLFANALLSLSNGVRLVTGLHYLGEAERVYAVFPALKTVDTLSGACSFLFAAMAIFTRMRLARFRRRAPWLYCGLLVANILDAMVYDFCVMAVTQINIWDAQTIVRPFVCLCMLIANVVYFKRRADLFVR